MGFEHSPPHIYIHICSLGILCGWVLCMRASEPVHFNPVGVVCRVCVCASHCHGKSFCIKQLQEKVSWTTQGYMLLLCSLLCYETLVFIISTFNNLNILLSKMSLIYIFLQVFYVSFCSIRIPNIWCWLCSVRMQI